MIKHEMKTRNEHVTAYYKTHDHYLKATTGEYPSARILQMAHLLYDHKQNKFIKNRDTGDCDLLNAMLMVAQNRHKMTDKMWELVNEHA